MCRSFSVSILSGFRQTQFRKFKRTQSTSSTSHPVSGCLHTSVLSHFNPLLKPFVLSYENRNLLVKTNCPLHPPSNDDLLVQFKIQYRGVTLKFEELLSTKDSHMCSSILLRETLLGLSRSMFLWKVSTVALTTVTTVTSHHRRFHCCPYPKQRDDDRFTLQTSRIRTV